MSIRETVLSAMRQVAAEQKRELPALNDDTVLLDSGLDSLCFAILVARLEGELGVDPFTAADEFSFPVTVGDFVAMYRAASVDAAA